MTAERIARLRKAVGRHDWNFQPSKAELIELLDLGAEALRLRETLDAANKALLGKHIGDANLNVLRVIREALSPRGEKNP